MRVARFEIFHAPNASIDKLPYSDDTYVFYLLHLQRAVVPDSGSEASLQ
jgi:hypothetical protein